MNIKETEYRELIRDLVEALKSCDFAMGGNLPEQSIGGRAREASKKVQERASLMLLDKSA